VEPEWVERVKAAADRLGLTATSFVTMVVNDWLNKNEMAPPGKGKKK